MSINARGAAATLLRVKVCVFDIWRFQLESVTWQRLVGKDE